MSRSLTSAAILCGLLAAPAIAQSPAQVASNAGPHTTAVGTHHVVRYVSQRTGSDRTGDGSAARPWAGIDHALSQITDAGPACTYAVLVATGTYAGSTIHLKPYVDLYGGHDPSAWKRDVRAFATTLDGERARRVIEGADHCRIDGFRIVRGRVRGRGAAVLCDAVSPSFTNNVFYDNRTERPENWNPKEMHEDANDGGAVACINGAAPAIENDLFAANATEAGRGGAVACHRHAAPRIFRNVFVGNRTGLDDPQRSSDGGAISAWEYSNPEIAENVIVGNETLASNDGGGLAIAYWTSARLMHNLIVGNKGADDGGAAFVGGQKHHYGTPLDPVPSRDKFLVHFEGNLIAGNRNTAGSSGAMRVTMESRAIFVNNVFTDNPGGLYLQASEAELRNNAMLDPLRAVKESKSSKTPPGPTILVNNRLRGGVKLEGLTANAERNVDADPILAAEGLTGSAEIGRRDENQFVSAVRVANANWQPGQFAGRAILAGDRWGVVRSNDRNTLWVWGLGEAAGVIELRILPSFANLENRHE